MHHRLSQYWANLNTRLISYLEDTTISKKLLGAFACILIVMLVGSLTFLRELAIIQASGSKEEHTHQVIEHMTDMTISIMDQEMGFRDYLFYGDRDGIALYNSAYKKYKKSYMHLTQLVQENIEQKGRLKRVDKLVQAWRNSIGDLSLANPYAIAGEVNKNDFSLEKIRALINEIVDIEYELLEARSWASFQAGREAFMIAIFGPVLGAAAAGLLIVLLARFIALPIVNLTDIMQRLVDGDRGIRLEGLKRKDEIGDMTRSVEVFRKHAIERAGLVEELKKAKEESEMANRTKSFFLANMTHELRTPMNGVIGMAKILEDTPLDAKQKELLSIIKNSGDTLLTLISDILDFSKIEAGKLDIEIVPFRIKEFMDETLKLIELKAHEKSLTLDYAIDKEVPLAVKSDPRRIRQILMNFISNSIKFTEKGGISVAVTLLSSAEGQSKIEFAVTDTGMGISQKLQSELFKEFTQVDTSASRKFEGTGLGLAISKNLAGLLGGSTAVDSEEGKGSTFSFSILAKDADPSEIKEITEEKSSSEERKGMSLEVLLVEDNIVNQKVALAFLKKLGYEPDLAENGLEAVAAVEKKTYDLIFMDLMMPEMDGMEATQKIRMMGDSLEKRPWIIAMTADAIKGTRDKCLNIGMDAYITKPISLGALEQGIEEACREMKAMS